MGKRRDIQPRRLRNTENRGGIKDETGYSLPDSGCKKATEYLGGKQSLCLECPFDECYFCGDKKVAKQKNRVGKMSITKSVQQLSECPIQWVRAKRHSVRFTNDGSEPTPTRGFILEEGNVIAFGDTLASAYKFIACGKFAILEFGDTDIISQLQ